MRLPILDRKLRFALVGCGRISANHIDALARHGDRAELVAVCDNRPEALNAAVASTGAPGFASLTELLAATDADVVALATPSGLHPRQAIEVAQAGRHVLSEKPMATKWDEGMAMVRACRDARVKLFVVKQNRLNATMQLLKRRSTTGASAASSWSPSTSSGRGRRATTTKHPGAAAGISTAAHS
jgi:UDP-N-acetyl-2-amino-2-deoxyglucuronate dehydrogenase